MTASARARARRGGGPQPYDFRRPSSLSREHLRALHLAYETFARQASTVFTTRLRAVSQVTLSEVEQVSYDDYIRGLGSTAFLAVHTCEPLPGAGILALDLRTAMRCVDRLLGGPGTGDQPDRAFTDIESTLLRGLAQRLLQEIPYAFEAITPLSATVTALEANPQFVQVAAPSDVMVVATFDVRVDEADSIASLALPLAPLLPALDAAVARNRHSHEGAAADVGLQIRARLAEAPVAVSVHFQPVRVPSRVVLDLAVGDVLPLGHLVTLPLSVSTDDVECAQAVPGARGNHLACRIVGPAPTDRGAASVHTFVETGRP